MSNEPTTAVQPFRPRTAGDLLLKVQGLEITTREIKAILPPGVSVERFVNIAKNAVLKMPNIQQCTVESTMTCLRDVASLGLDVDGKRASLIPFRDKCTMIIGYQGMIELAMKSGIVRRVFADIVCDNDDFEENMGEIVRHRIDRKAARGEPYAAYAFIEMKDGSRNAVCMSKDEINAIRDASQGYRYAKQKGSPHPWINNWGEMAKKTAIRRLSKWMPLSPEIKDGFEKDDEDFSPTPPPDLDALATRIKAAENQQTEDAPASDEIENPTPNPAP